MSGESGSETELDEVGGASGRGRGGGAGRKQQATTLGNDIQVFNQEVSELMKVLVNAASSCVQGFTGKEKTQALKKFHKAALDLTREKIKVGKTSTMMDKVLGEMDLNKGNLTNKEFMEKLDTFGEKTLAAVQNSSVDQKELDNDVDYQEFLEVMLQLSDPSKADGACSSSGAPPAPASADMESQGIEALTEHLVIRDPLTRKLFANPRVNRKCHHVYDYDNLNLVISKKCPYPGCPVVVKKKDVVEDHVLAKRIQEKIQEAYGEED